MLSQKLLKSAILLTLLIALTSCYTRFGAAQVEPVEDVYGYEGEPAQEEFYENDVVVSRHIYVDRYYHPGHFYFDPYDAWYFEPGFHFSVGYYYGPRYYSPVHYVPPYYASPVYACIPPVYYPPYWHPVHYPVHHPVYYPGPYYGGHSGPHYGGSTTPMKRRNFGKRSDTAIASRTTLNRRGSGNDGYKKVSRRTYSTGDGGSGGRFVRRNPSSTRNDNTPDPNSGTYKRQVVRKRSDDSGSGNKSYSPGRNKRSDTKRSYKTRRSYGTKSGPGYSTPKRKSSSPKVSSGRNKSAPSVSTRGSYGGSRSTKSSRVTRSGSGSRKSSVTRSRSTGSRSSSPARVTGSGSRSSTPSRSVSSGSSRSSGSSKSSSGSGRSRRR